VTFASLAFSILKAQTMTEPIRMLHFADTHIGVENYGKTDPQTGLSSRVVDFLRRMDEMIEYARAEDIDLFIFAGDAFKTRSPNPTYQREFAHRIRDLAELGPVILLVGNHDLPPTVKKASSIEIYETLAVPNVWVAQDYETRVVATKRGEVVVATAPYPVRARLLEDADTAGMTIAETDAQLQRELTAILEDLAVEADEHDMPRVLTGHFTVDGAVVGSERAIMLGRDIVVMRSAVADPRWDYVALGHIHKHQDLTKGRKGLPPVVYSGSMERIDFGEEGDAKGFCHVELQRGKALWDFVQVDARRFVTLRADLRTSTQPTEDMLTLINKHQLKNTVVRIIMQLTPETESHLNEALLRDALRRAGVYHIAGLRKDVEQSRRQRLPSPEGLTNMELLEHYFIAKEVPTPRRKALLATAQQIMDEVAEQE